MTQQILHSEISKLSDEEFVSAVHKLLVRVEPGGLSMIAVAYPNFLVMRSATFTLSRKDKSLPTNPDELLSFTSELMEKAKQENDDVNYRRLFWFYCAGLIDKINLINNSNLLTRQVDIWILLLKECVFIEERLENSIIWDEEEKVWFEGLKDKKDAITVLAYYVSNDIRYHPKMISFINLNSSI